MEILLPILFVVVVIVVIQYAIATEFHNIACQKGHAEKKYLWYCFWLGFIGYCMVIALPDRLEGQAPSVSKDELPDL